MFVSLSPTVPEKPFFCPRQYIHYRRAHTPRSLTTAISPHITSARRYQSPCPTARLSLRSREPASSMSVLRSSTESRPSSRATAPRCRSEFQRRPAWRTQPWHNRLLPHSNISRRMNWFASGGRGGRKGHCQTIIPLSPPVDPFSVM